MTDFILAALPWVAIGVSVAILAVGRHRRTAKNHLTDGMCVGMCIGAALGSTGVFSIGLGISLGMLAGEIVGMNIPAK
jgi:hypothetical protein